MHFFMEQILNRYLFVINPIAGGNDKDELESKLQDVCRKNEIDYQFYLTTGENDEEEVKGLIQDFDPQVVVAAGGDGTVNLVARQVLFSKRVLGIIPLGSGNGLAKDLKLPHSDLNRIIQILMRPKIIEIDTLEANGRFFMHISDLGFNAHIVRLFNETKKRGLLSYMRFTAKEFFKYKTFKYQLTTDKGFYKGLAFMITVANSNQFGSYLTINPEGKYDDGQFEVIIIKRFPKKKVLNIFFRLLTKRINFSPYTIVLKCTRAQIVTRKKKTLQYDGEIYGKVNETNISINHKSLKVIVSP